MTAYESLITQVTIVPKNQPTYSEMAVCVAIEDESSGAFVVVDPQCDDKKLRIDAESWPELRKQIELALDRCEEWNKRKL